MKEWLKSGEQKKHYWTDKRRNTLTGVNKLFITAAIVFTVFIPVIYFYNTFLHPHTLVLKKLSHDVTIRSKRLTLLLAPGDYLKEGYEFKTGERSTCTIQYTQKSTVAMDEKTEMNIAEFSKSRILFGLDNGEIHIKENKNKGAIIHVNTPIASLYTMGTDYFVKHQVNEMVTIVKVVEGLVHIETIPRKHEIMVKAGEEVIIRKDKVPLIKEVRPDIEEEWYILPIYTQSPVKSAIIDFDKDIIVAGTEQSLIAGTEQSLVCFTRDKIIWEYIPEKVNFLSKPIIYNNHVYIPTLRNLLCFNLSTGIKESSIEMRDTIRSGHHLILYKHDLYIIFASGIYVFDQKTDTINTEPLIPVIDATLPVFHTDIIFITSYITNEIRACDLSGKTIWSFELNDKSNCSPVVADTIILTGTKQGTLYRITIEGVIEKTIQLRESIISIIYGNSRVFFIMAGGGKLYEINLHTFEIEKVYYHVNTAIVYDNNVVMGMTDGRIKIIGLQIKKEFEIMLPYSEASAFIGYDKSVYVGLQNGCILKIGKEK
ncbi:MAG: PQQ-binding-like beta-propeller repeat protein [Spirochaetales bacterium]|nr:PQQ-binding-like beta-propeller repeat protein [Spirochaetales bacterium]